MDRRPEHSAMDLPCGHVSGPDLGQTQAHPRRGGPPHGLDRWRGMGYSDAEQRIRPPFDSRGVGSTWVELGVQGQRDVPADRELASQPARCRFLALQLVVPEQSVCLDLAAVLCQQLVCFPPPLGVGCSVTCWCRLFAERVLCPAKSRSLSDPVLSECAPAHRACAHIPATGGLAPGSGKLQSGCGPDVHS